MNSLWLRVSGSLLLSLLLSACSTFDNLTWGGNPDPPAPVVEAGPGVEALLVRMVDEADSPREQLQARVAVVEQHYADWGDVASRIELAWLLSRPDSGVQDYRRSVLLLREYLALPHTDPGYQALAQLLYDLLLERAVQRAASSQARDALVAERRQADDLQEQITTLQQLLATLQRQLNALRDMERSISDRPSPDSEQLLPQDAEQNSPGG